LPEPLSQRAKDGFRKADQQAFLYCNETKGGQGRPESGRNRVGKKQYLRESLSCLIKEKRRETEEGTDGQTGREMNIEHSRSVCCLKYIGNMPSKHLAKLK
jgi:hypothetical protein